MKNILFGLSFLFLSGCTVVQPIIDRFTISQFDENEYALINKIRTTALLASERCDDQLTAALYSKSVYYYGLELKNYSQYLPKNYQTIKSVDILFAMTKDAYKRYSTEKNVSKTYCELKFKSIHQSAEKIQNVVGKRPRP